MKFETCVAKYEDHEVFSEIKSKLPTVRLYENSKYALGIALHKWSVLEGSSKGNYIAVYKICEFQTSWDSIDLQTAYDFIHAEEDTIKSIDFSSIENHNCEDSSVIVYKYSVSAWRNVETSGKKVKKWTFSDTKPTKEDESKIQRLLK